QPAPGQVEGWIHRHLGDAGVTIGVDVVGTLMQALTRNPIADPGILGINTGASLAMVTVIAFAGITTLPQY
ncbi:Ferrichrome ABC superfamily ATP binding cassette transporter, membrane protein, partial [human gut metagenome]